MNASLCITLKDLYCGVNYRLYKNVIIDQIHLFMCLCFAYVCFTCIEIIFTNQKDKSTLNWEKCNPGLFFCFISAPQGPIKKK